MLAGLSPFIYKIRAWTPKISFSCDILWSAHHMEGEFWGNGQWQRPEHRDRMQMMGCTGRGVWLVFKNRQMEGCLRSRQTAKGHQGQSKKRLVCEIRGVLGIQWTEEQARRFSTGRQSTATKGSGAFIYSFNSYWKGDILGKIQGGRLTFSMREVWYWYWTVGYWHKSGVGVTSLRDCDTKLGSYNHSFHKQLFSNYYVIGSGDKDQFLWPYGAKSQT